MTFVYVQLRMFYSVRTLFSTVVLPSSSVWTEFEGDYFHFGSSSLSWGMSQVYCTLIGGSLVTLDELSKQHQVGRFLVDGEFIMIKPFAQNYDT